ncbi:hypothetical protein SAMN05216548_12517 [Faunimonas pinastri]|uniref:Uncharacterized protein n=1 Tax=Faunimonas pinastri TaxID=1855383 RepID=A0A1H9Q5C5_9HYPH|nr:hypothetical protein SAMN05216548_12517 [Faunimonas pinastri]
MSGTLGPNLELSPMRTPWIIQNSDSGRWTNLGHGRLSERAGRSRPELRFEDNQDFGAFVKNGEGEVIAGLIGNSRWNGFQFDMLVVPELLLGQGLGS